MEELIACAVLVWVCLTDVVLKTGQTIYQIKHGLLGNYLRNELRNPAVRMVFA